eukprot:6362110-Amphidinium_carterae.1
MVQLVSSLLSRLPPGRIWPHSDFVFRRVFLERLCDLRATNDFSLSNSMASAMERGRWTSPATARIYIVEALAALQDMQISPCLRASSYAAAHGVQILIAV